jgi:hypothetical protein
MVVRIVRRINARHRTRLGGLVGGDRESPDLEFSIDPVELVEEVKRWRAELDPPASVD